jgi:hypothetical protein
MLEKIRKKKLFERVFIFEAHHAKGYEKLRDNQFSSPEHGIVQEPVANALDQQQGDEPINITLEKNKKFYELTFRDNGIGLVLENLESLHFIGQSAKKKHKDMTIGRFGMGLVGAFNSSLGIKKVEIQTRVCGQSAIIVYDCSQKGIPTWCMKKKKINTPGFAITFCFPETRYTRIHNALTAFLKQTVVPVNFNGTQYCFDPGRMAGGNDICVTIQKDPAVYYAARPDGSGNWSFIDDIRIYLRRMPLEKGNMYPMFISTSGSKLPQNYRYPETPYMQDESCIVLSEKGEPTLGRDTLIRNKDFDSIRKNVEIARSMALIKLFEPAISNPSKKQHDYADNMAIANIYSLQDPLAKRIQSEEKIVKNKGPFTTLLDTLLHYPLFPVFNSCNRLSITDILSTRPKGNIFFFAESIEAATFLEGAHHCDFILKEKVYFIEELWGGHEHRRIGTILKPLLEKIEGIELISMDELMWNDKMLEDLSERGIISRTPLKIKTIRSPDETVTDFLNRLKKLLNLPWFRRALVRFHPPKRIRLLPIKIQKSFFSGEIVAAVLNGKDSNPHELVIGICIDSMPIQSILKNPHSELAALPIICHELSHHRRKLLDEAEEYPSHNDLFHLDRIHLEGNVLRNCVNHLLGKEDELCQDHLMGMSTDGSDVLVL